MFCELHCWIQLSRIQFYTPTSHYVQLLQPRCTMAYQRTFDIQTSQYTSKPTFPLSFPWKKDHEMKDNKHQDFTLQWRPDMTAEWGSSHFRHILNGPKPQAQSLQTALQKVPREKICFPGFLCSSWHIWGTTVK